MTARTACVVLNGASGALLDQPDMGETLAAAFRAHGLEPRFVDPEFGSLAERMAAASRSGADIVVVAGGDGTIACAAQAAAESGATLGILPFGTMNMLAKDLGVPTGDVAAAIRVLAEGEVRLIDIGDVNGHVFLCASMLGLPARLARYREAGRGRASPARFWTRYARAALRLLAHYRRLRCVVRIDGVSTTLKASAVTITPNAVDEATGRLFGRSRLDSGELRLYVIRHLGVAQALRIAARALVGRWRSDPALFERAASAIDILSGKRSARVMNDGEVMLLEPPLAYRIRPRALKVMAPATGARQR